MLRELRRNTFRDRTGWDAGPWDGEPDYVQWRDTDTGLPCLAVRNSLGAWCGYVGVAEPHPWFGYDYDEVDAENEPHGGLTFADTCQTDTAEGEGICHVPEPGEPEHVWWFGFDCAHAGDTVPGMDAQRREAGVRTTLTVPIDGVYRDLGYVADECQRLAERVAVATG